ncbi:sugar transferase [Alphaproteobacteria bacterium]|nr:sugar transferase [Alphaproteobacteria bacterium]
MIRLFDIFVSIIIILFFIILTFPIILTKLIFDGFPLFYVSKRVGLLGHEIVVYKFRTMINDPKKIEDYIKNITNEEIYQRIPITSEIYTGVGRFFEKIQLVELPQLCNVLYGNMSLVGNRPLPKYVNLQLIDRFGQKIVNDRMSVLPGMTGVSQIIGKSLLSDQKRLECEVNYAEFRMKSTEITSLYLNFLILIQTIFIIFIGKGFDPINRKIINMLKIDS